MQFDENLFADFQINQKVKKRQASYEARNHELGWFLSNDDTENYEDMSTYILKNKADYFYAEREYRKALKSYEELSQSIPKTNSMLCHEIDESVALCLQKLNKNLEAKIVIEKMLETNKMDVSLWMLLYKVHHSREDRLGAIFALQHCIQLHQDVVNYWFQLAMSYSQLSNCFEFKDCNKCCLNYNSQKAKCDCENKSTKQRCLLSNIGESTSNTGATIIKRLNEMTMLDNKTDKVVAAETDEVINTYVQGHHYCFRTLCSVITARFLQHKYSFHSSTLQYQKRCENFQETGDMIKEVTCASDTIIKTTEKLLNEKFAKYKSSLSTVADKNTMFATDEMTEQIQAFERHWFPLT